MLTSFASCITISDPQIVQDIVKEDYECKKNQKGKRLGQHYYKGIIYRVADLQKSACLQSMLVDIFEQKNASS